MKVKCDECGNIFEIPQQEKLAKNLDGEYLCETCFEKGNWKTRFDQIFSIKRIYTK